MRLERVDPLLVTSDQVAGIAAVINAAQAVDSSHQSETTVNREALYLRYGWENRPLDAVLLAYAGDRVIGLVYVELALHDNLDLGVLAIECHPDYRDSETPDELLKAGLAELRAFGRTSALADAWQDAFWHHFFVRNGFEVGYHGAQRRLWMSRLDWTELDRLHAESLTASPGYDVIEVPNPAPDELMPGLIDLHQAMNDAPNDDLEIEDEVWDEARSRDWEQVHINRGMDAVRLVAVRRVDGTLGGITIIAIEDERPTLGFQDDTGVLASHRGHRLGIRLKIEMLRLLRTRYPQLETIDTWNAESNAPMVAVNAALGSQVVAQGVELQRSID